MSDSPTGLADVTRNTREAPYPYCKGNDLVEFYEVESVPVHSVLLVRSEDEALRFPTGRIKLAYCRDTGFITNLAFDPNLLNYSAEYEETQGFSPTFNAFHKRLALDLIDRYDLRKKKIIEIGCGKGEFLDLICELGDNTGIGFDPAFVEGRNPGLAASRTTFVTDFYSEKYSNHHADFVCCKMTLEHIQETHEFIGTVRKSVGDRHDTVVFFQIPDAARVLRDLAFWDIYYEHCSYFTRGSLAQLFRAEGFDVIDLWTDYDDQYLMISARPSTGKSAETSQDGDNIAERLAPISFFADNIQERLHSWRTALGTLKASGRRVALWGGGSKAVAFLTTLGVTDEIDFAVDINPHKQGTFLAKSGHEIVGPERLKSDRPDVVVVMNPIYIPEITKDLEQLGLSPRVFPVDADPLELVAQ